VLRGVDNFRAHRTGRNAALIAHYGFLSIFPLLLVLTTVLGFVLQNRADWRDEIVDSALRNLPFVGQQIETDPDRLRGNIAILILGLLLATWSGMRAFVGFHGALDDIRETPLDRRANLAATRLHALMALGVVGGAQVATAIITAFVGSTGWPVISKVLLVLAAIAINTGVLAFGYRWLCSRAVTWRSVWPGAVFGGVVFAVLQVVGTTIVSNAIAGATPVYGTFATVIGLLTWLSLHSMIALLGAEMNQIIAQRQG
jgi:membrane protein